MKVYSVHSLYYFTDKIAPNIICPENVTLWLTNKDGNEVFAPLPTADDDVDPSPTVVVEPASVNITIKDLRTAKVFTGKAMDKDGNEAICQFAAEIRGKVDFYGPMLRR